MLQTIKMIPKGFGALLNFIIANTIGRIVYNGQYFKGRHFQKWYSTGWKWVTRGILFQKILGYNRNVPFPVSEKIFVGNYKNIEFDINDLNIFHVFGDYYQAWNEGKIIIGSGTYIAPNVGIITSNHDLYDLDKRMPAKNVKIGEKCWIGMNSMILPGVELGEHTIVGAGSVVTKSFKEGNCVIAGNPAKKIKDLQGEEVMKNEN